MWNTIAELLYEDNGKHSSGKFLVRKHAKKDQHYVMSVIYKTEATHHLITPDATGSSKLAINKQSTGTTTVAEVCMLSDKKRTRLRLIATSKSIFLSGL